MKRKFTDMEKIERYLGDRVNQQEREEMNRRLMDDEEFRRLFDEVEVLLEGIKRSAAKTTAEEKLQNLENTVHLPEENESRIDESEGVELAGVGPGSGQETVPVIIIWYNRPAWRWAIAASILLFVASVYVFGPFHTMSDERLFAEYFEPRVNYDRTRGEITMNQIQEAYAAYDNKEWQKAVNLFEQILPNTDNKVADMIYLGNAYLALEQGEKAIPYFKEVNEMKAGYALEAKWYLALSYLQVGDRENARKEFLGIIEADIEYVEDSKEILSKMKKANDMLMNLIQFSN